MKSIAKKFLCPLIALAAALVILPASASAQTIQPRGAGTPTRVVEQIDYSTRTVKMLTKIQTGKLHEYSTLGQDTNDCVAVAGAIVLAYYDLFDKTVIPDFNTGAAYNGGYIFIGQNTKVNTLIQNLHGRMGTSEGITVTGFRNGMNSYLGQNGHSMTTSSVMVSGKVGMSLIQQKFQANQPVVVFLSGYVFVSEGNAAVETGRETLQVDYSTTAMHAVVAYGCEQVVYDEFGSNPRTDTYLYVSFGTGELGRIRIDSTDSLARKCNVDNALAVSIS